MAMNKEELLAAIRDNFSTLDYIRPSEIPNIDLYMDQVTTFMDKRLAKSRRYDNDKILTKTMINNYAKNDLLPPPVKKKYSKEHMLLLIFIYYFKNILSIGDIQKVLEPISSHFFPEGGSMKLEDVYEEVFSLEKEQIDLLQEDLLAKLSCAEKTFQDVDGEDQDLLQLFSFICLMSFDVYMKKQLIEKLIDTVLTK
ncbi:DUF1836 domain-containing protein [Oscillospiraceae bacterium Marseille-Q3528]|nr:DUF1836 domain-containing protein [Oscillospiraceae bacterium Marseille-Q3528]